MRIGLLRKQQPFAEYDPRTSMWRIWYIFNNDVTSGTYYELQADGTCDRVTVLNRDIVSIDRVCNPSTEPVEELARQHEWQGNYEL